MDVDRPTPRSRWQRVRARLAVILDHKIVSGVLIGVITAVVLAVLGLGGGGGDEDTDPPGPPVLADVDLQVEVAPDEVAGPGEPFFYWLPDDVRTLDPPPDDCRARRDWAFGAGGADADVTWAKLTLENNRDRQVRISDLRLQIDGDEPVDAGTVAACPVGGASSEPYGLAVDLTKEPPVLQFREDQGEEFGEVPEFQLDPGEQDAFTIYVWARPERVVSWRLVADVRSGGKSTELLLPPKEEDPLRIAGTVGRPMFVWTDSRWEPYEP